MAGATSLGGGRAAIRPLASAFLTAALFGLVVAASAPLGVAMLFTLLYLPLALSNLPVALAVFVPTIFIEGIPGSRLAPEVVGVLLGVGWLGALRAGTLRRSLDVGAPVFAAIAAMLAWWTVSLAWAESTLDAVEYLWPYWEVGIFLLLVATVPHTPRQLRMVAGAFVGGALLSVAIGLIGMGASAAQVEEGGRLMGGAGDANYFAAALMPAIALAGGLAGASETRRGRRLAAVAIAPLAIGVAGSQSRGALVAALVMLVAALVLFPEKRGAVASSGAAIVLLGALWFALNPGSFDRIVNDKYGGSGRQDLWRVGLRVVEQNPVVGVGLGNFQVHAPRHVREPGSLRYVRGILRGQEPHNVYLGLLAETGVIGLVLFLLVPLASLRCALRASVLFQRAGWRGLSVLSRAAFVGTLGALTTSFFLPNGTDKRLWVLMGIGPAALVVARRLSAGWTSEASPPDSGWQPPVGHSKAVAGR